MRRQAKSPKTKPETKRSVSRKADDAKVRDLENRLAEALKREAEALERETAASEILRIISSSRADVQPVLDAVAQSAARVCAAYDAVILRLEGDGLHMVAHHGPIGHWGSLVVPASRGTVSGRTVLDRQMVHVTDLQAEVDEFPEGSAFARQFGHRSIVSVPLLREGVAIGLLALRRAEVQPFTEKQIALLKTFADQAVIAIENVRLFTELETRNRELSTALDQQTATADILRVISSSPTDLAPVMAAVVRSAARLCGASEAQILLPDGDVLRLVAEVGLSAMPPVRPISRGYAAGRAFVDRRTLHIPDMHAVLSEYPETSATAFGTRTHLATPLMREGLAIGVIRISRREVLPFSNQQIALLKTFADQAVIAIENVRLFTELQASNRELTTALDTQTATSDILSVISRSQTDVQPVFDAILTSAVRLLRGYFGALARLVGDQIELAATTFATGTEDPAVRAVFPYSVHSEGAHAQAIRQRGPVNFADAQTEPALSEARRAIARARGYRSLVVVPLLRPGEALGTIAVARREAGGFADDEIALLQTFADQAVIAIENVRLFTELQEKNRELTEAHAQVTESLEQQTATAEVLKVISRSTFDLQPVLDTLVENATKLCDGSYGAIFRFDGMVFRMSASYGVSPQFREFWRGRELRPGRGSVVGRVGLEHQPVHVLDVLTDPEFQGAEIQRIAGFRTVMGVPMLRESMLIGAFFIWRNEVRAFTDKQIGLVTTFADQAVIAIENVRLFTELQDKNRALTEAHAQVTESLDRQTATSEILRVISRSPTNVQPVFDAIIQNAVTLCSARFGVVYRYDGDLIHIMAHHNFTPEALAILSRNFPTRPGGGTVSSRAIAERAVVHVSDSTDPMQSPPASVHIARTLGYRAMVSVPMVRDGEPLGTITLARTESGLFSNAETAMLQTFADQAVIAIENVRLFTELETRNKELTEALEQQTATSEVLKVISRSTFDLQPVLETLTENVTKLCDAAAGTIWRFDGEVFRAGALYAQSAELRKVWGRGEVQLGRGSSVGRAGLERRAVQILDVLTDPEFQHRDDFQRISGARTMVGVPMLRDGVLIGGFSLWRTEVRAFTDKQIELVTTFADQAVIAIENARLLEELQARTGELTRSVGELRALGEVSQAVSSTLDLQTVLSTIVARATLLAGADAGIIYEYEIEKEIFRPRATERLESHIVEALVTAPVRKGEGATGQLAVVREPVQLSDIHIDYLPNVHHARDTFVRAGYRALLAVPLLREGHLIGGLTVMRKTPGDFSRETIELLQTFATQSFLAIQNARLFQEVADKSRQLEIASQHKSEFLANMSHELRTPLNAVIGFSDVLLEGMFGEVNEKQTEYLRDILASGQHLLSLINDILDLSKIEAGRMELELSDFDVPTAIGNALTLMRERASRHEITLSHVLDERLGEIRGDERKFKQVLLNLLSNAVKFTPNGGKVEVRARLVDSMVEVAVADTGEGIAPRDQQAVFEEFRQVGKSAKKVEGTGLGLALCRKFVELHGGTITLESQIGVGSTFTFTVPVRPTRDRADVTAGSGPAA